MDKLRLRVPVPGYPMQRTRAGVTKHLHIFCTNNSEMVVSRLLLISFLHTSPLKEKTHDKEIKRKQAETNVLPVITWVRTLP